MAPKQRTHLGKFFTVAGFGFALGLTLALSRPMSDENIFSIDDPFRGIRGAFSLISLNDGVNPHAERDTHIKFVSHVIGRVNRNADQKKLAHAIVNEAIRANVDPLFIAAVVKSESTFKTSAVSHKGAQGLMQLMPTTAQFTREKIAPALAAKQRHNLHHVDYNLALGIAYLKHLQRIFKGNSELALIAYNWGPGNLLNALKTRSRIPGETREYARKILRNQKMWQQEMLIHDAVAKTASKSNLG